MVDIAQLGIAVQSNDVPIATTRLQQMTAAGGQAEASTNKLSSSFGKLAGYIKAAAAAIGLYKLYELAKDAALLSARYETLGVVMTTVGNNAGYTGKQMEAFQVSLQKQGIAMVESRQVLTQMASAHMDLAKSSELARIAQDAAVIGQMNSSEAFEKMITGIQRGETEIMKTLGLNVDFAGAQERLASQLGKTAQSLTQTEKVQANMNATMLKGKDISGVYEASMDTAGKQISSMKRYVDNLKVTLGSTFNDVLIVGVQAFTGGLKEANTEAERMQREGQLQKWGRDLVMILAVIADGISLVFKVLNSFVVTGVAGLMQLYYGAKAFGQALMLDFSGAAESMQNLFSTGAAWSEMMAKTWEAPTKFQDAAKKMYADRDANKPIEDAKKAQRELDQMKKGAANADATAAQEQELFVKKHREEWGKVVVAQLESVGAYEQATALQIKLNKETDAYKTMLNKAPEAQAARAAQELLDQAKVQESRRKTLDLINEQAKAMQDLNKAELEARGMSSEEIGFRTKAAEMDQQEKALLDQIITESNPLLRAQLEEQALKQMEINDLLKQQNAIDIEIFNRKREITVLEESIRIAKILGREVDTKELEDLKVALAYKQKMAQYDKEIQSMRLSGLNADADRLEAIRSEISYAYDRKGLNDDTNNTLLQMLGLQSSITSEVNAQTGAIRQQDAIRRASLASATTLGDALNSEFSPGMVSQSFNMLSVTATGAADNLGAMNKQTQSVTTSFSELNKAQITATEAMMKTARDLASQGKSLAADLRSVGANIRQTQLDLAGGDLSTLSPEQKYLQAKALFQQTAQQAQTTGDVELFRKLPDMAKAFLEASKAYNASGATYASDYNSTQAILGESATNTDAWATLADQITTVLDQQVVLLEAIKKALETGGDTANLLSGLNANQSQLTAAINTIPPAVGATTAEVNKLLSPMGEVATYTSGTKDQLNPSTVTSAAWWMQKTALNAEDTSVTLAGSGTAGSAFNKIKDNTSLVLTRSFQKSLPGHYETTYSAGYPTSTWVDGGTVTEYGYTRYAKGGIANTASIFGEAGPEAAVPLPDGRSIPVTLSGTASADNRETIAELKAIIRTLQAGFSESIAISKQQARNSETIANSSRLAVNA